jgi:hypothetical protein
MTIGPMACQACHGRVWWRDAHLVMPYLGGWRKHNCRSVLEGRAAAEAARTWTPEYRRAYKREWRRRKAAA